MSTIVYSAHYDALRAREWNTIYISDLILCEEVYSLLTTLDRTVAAAICQALADATTKVGPALITQCMSIYDNPFGYL